MMIRRFAVVFASLCAGAQCLVAQNIHHADSLLARGIFDQAETEYYAAVRARPRDPNARFALGHYLASRGALRIGATLIDEAMQFGLDRRLGAMALSKVYMDLGEYEALSKLSAAPLSASEKALVRWLAEHPSKATAPDSSVLVAYTRSPLEGFLGAVRIRIDGRPILAQISPNAGCGIRIADTSTVVQKLRRYPADSIGDAKFTPAVADSVGYGRMAVTNVPVEAMALPKGVQAVICFGALTRYAPTFDPRAGLMTLRLGGTAPLPGPTSTVFPLIQLDGPYAIAQAGGWAQLVLPQVSSMLRDRRWTIDVKRGQLSVEP